MVEMVTFLYNQYYVQTVVVHNFKLDVGACCCIPPHPLTDPPIDLAAFGKETL